MSLRPLITLALLGGMGWGAFPLPWGEELLRLPAWAERVLYNPRERTGRAIEAFEQGHPERAVRPAGTALRLVPEDPLARFNAGTAQLGSGKARRALPLLEQAAQGIAGRPEPELAGAVHYNLGNARLAAGDPGGAVEAYKQALRAQPGHADAKFNLELALREEDRRLRSPIPRGGSRGGGGGQQPKDRPGDDRQEEEKDERQGEQERPSQGQQQGQDQSGRQGKAQPKEGESPADFRDQPEMTAAEAAALLESVENLERQQRRAKAAKQAQQRAVQGKDW